MNTQGQDVTVYNFCNPDGRHEPAQVSTFKATRQVIVDVFGGDPIEGTEQVVGVEELDEHGRYRRLATGWGELN